MATRAELRESGVNSNHRPWLIDRLSNALDGESGNLGLWLPVLIGAGIALWYSFGAMAWAIVGITALLLGALAMHAVPHSTLRRAAVIAASCLLFGVGLISTKAALKSAPVLERPWSGTLYAQIEDRKEIQARQLVRLTLRTAEHSGLPPRIRVNSEANGLPDGAVEGAVIRLRARLMPPAGPAIPGAYDFSARAWFDGIGATGSTIGAITIVQKSTGSSVWNAMRHRLSTHIRNQLPGTTGGIAAILVTGDGGAIDEKTAQAMRDSGLAHLLSISGLHVAAIVAACVMLISKSLALVPPLALRWPVQLIAAAAGAIAAVSYTLLAGAEVPTIRACIAALLILLAMAMGRDPLSMRLVAAGALFILVFWPESLVGPSFQLSFTAVTAIVWLHGQPSVRNFFQAPDQTLLVRLSLGIASLFVTGLVIELALAPIALFHFHKSGLYGAAANIFAIPLTTFIIMPLEATALLLDIAEWGTPFWWLCGQAIDLLIAIAVFTAERPGALARLPSFPPWLFAAMMAGMAAIALTRGHMRWAGVGAFAASCIVALLWPAPDLLVTGDGRHAAITTNDGAFIMLRSGRSDFTRDMLLQSSGLPGPAIPMDQWDKAQCSADICVFRLHDGNRHWDVMATRSRYLVPAMEMAAACSRVDIVISDRALPASCKPRWLKADRKLLSQTGGLAFYLSAGKLDSVARHSAHLPWSRLQTRVKSPLSVRRDQPLSRTRAMPNPLTDDQ